MASFKIDLVSLSDLSWLPFPVFVGCRSWIGVLSNHPFQAQLRLVLNIKKFHAMTHQPCTSVSLWIFEIRNLQGTRLVFVEFGDA